MDKTEIHKRIEYNTFLCNSIFKLILLMIFISCKARSVQNKPLKEVKIYNQTWMSEDLNVTHFRNGDKILHAATNKEWRRALSEKIPAWCHYRLKSKNGYKYIKLYNYYAVNNERCLAPTGWHIPTTKEWDELATNINPQEMMCSEAKWLGNVNNKSSFSAWPVYGRNENGTFEFSNISCSWWCSNDAKWYTLSEESKLNNYVLWEDLGAIMQNSRSELTGKPNGVPLFLIGYPVRCIKNNNNNK